MLLRRIGREPPQMGMDNGNGGVSDDDDMEDDNDKPRVWGPSLIDNKDGWVGGVMGVDNNGGWRWCDGACHRHHLCLCLHLRLCNGSIWTREAGSISCDIHIKYISKWMNMSHGKHSSLLLHYSTVKTASTFVTCYFCYRKQKIKYAVCPLTTLVTARQEEEHAASSIYKDWKCVVVCHCCHRHHRRINGAPTCGF